MELWRYLDIRPGITAVIGGGGKTTLLRTLGEELAARGRVLLCTTTKIYPFPGLPLAEDLTALAALEGQSGPICAGTPLPGTGKLTAPKIPFSLLAERFDHVLVEADGSAGRPMKAHAPHEPPIPPETGQTVCVAGASGFGRPIREAAHRPERFAQLADCGVEDPVTPAALAAVLAAEGLHQRVFINQVETEQTLAQAQELASLLDCPMTAGSLWKGAYRSCW